MHTKAAFISVLVALSEARFGQEQVPIAAISASSGGESGDAATLAGAAISTLLGGANPCDKLKIADEIVATLGEGGLEAAKGLVAAEQNFNPNAVDRPTLCSDPTLPTTEALRGITPLVDPAVDGAAAQNVASAASLETPLDAEGKSVADITAAEGFTTFLTKDATGAAGAAPEAGAGANNAGADADADANVDADADADADANVDADADANNAGADADADANVDADTDADADAAAGDACAPVDAVPTTLATLTRGAQAVATGAAANNNDDKAEADNADEAEAEEEGAAGGAAAADGAADFGTCSPAMDFVLGRPGRAADEGTFLPTDPVVAQGQLEALNPNIITSRICDQLTNVCGANQAAKDQCEAAKATVEALGTRDATTADAWNEAVGA